MESSKWISRCSSKHWGKYQSFSPSHRLQPRTVSKEKSWLGLEPLSWRKSHLLALSAASSRLSGAASPIKSLIAGSTPSLSAISVSFWAPSCVATAWDGPASSLAGSSALSLAFFLALGLAMTTYHTDLSSRSSLPATFEYLLVWGSRWLVWIDLIWKVSDQFRSALLCSTVRNGGLSPWHGMRMNRLHLLKVAVLNDRSLLWKERQLMTTLDGIKLPLQRTKDLPSLKSAMAALPQWAPLTFFCNKTPSPCLQTLR